MGYESPKQLVLFKDSLETLKIRKSRIYRASANPWSYWHPTPPIRKSTTELPLGTQAELIKAAALAPKLGTPLNMLLTVKWDSLYYHDSSDELFTMQPPERISHILERIRKWITARSDKAFTYIWAREQVEGDGEHWHVGLHLPEQQQPFIVYLGNLLGEPARIKPRPVQDRTEGELATSEWGSWHLAADRSPERAGYYIAAYLGKGEPSARQFRGKLVNNSRKPVRGQEYGGTEPTGRYDPPQGNVIGTARMTRRYDIAKSLKADLRTK